MGWCGRGKDGFRLSRCRRKREASEVCLCGLTMRLAMMCASLTDSIHSSRSWVNLWWVHQCHFFAFACYRASIIVVFTYDASPVIFSHREFSSWSSNISAPSTPITPTRLDYILLPPQHFSAFVSEFFKQDIQPVLCAHSKFDCKARSKVVPTDPEINAQRRAKHAQ